MIVPGKVWAALEKAEALRTDKAEEVPVPSQEPDNCDCWVLHCCFAFLANPAFASGIPSYVAVNNTHFKGFP